MAAAHRRRHARRSASTRGWPRCSTWCATPAGAGSEETIGEDPYLVGDHRHRVRPGPGVGRDRRHPQALRRLLRLPRRPQPRAGRHRARASWPTSILPPFEMAVREGGARSVMHSYTDIDGVPAAADAALLTGLLRDTWGFTGTVVADYFGIAFLETCTASPATRGEAAGARAGGRGGRRAAHRPQLTASRCVAAVADGEVAEALVDRAAAPGAAAEVRTRPARRRTGRRCRPCSTGTRPRRRLRGTVDLDPPANRALARQLAEQAVVLLRQRRRSLPLARPAGSRSSARSPRRRRPCWAATPSPATSASQHPEVPVGIETADRCSRRCARSSRRGHRCARAGCDVDGTDTAGIAAAVAARPGTPTCASPRSATGPGCSAAAPAARAATPPTWRCPACQGELLDALLATGTPVVLVLLTGRPYALGRWADRAAADRAGVLPRRGGRSGAGRGAQRPGEPLRAGCRSACRSGRAASRGRTSQPPLGLASEVSNVDPTPLFPFGHGLTYTTFEWEARRPPSRPSSRPTAPPTSNSPSATPAAGRAPRSCSSICTTRSPRPPAGVAADRLRPGAARPRAGADASGSRFHADLVSFTGCGGRRIVEPGELELRLATSSAAADVQQIVQLPLTGPERTVDHRRRLVCDTSIELI